MRETGRLQPASAQIFKSLMTAATAGRSAARRGEDVQPSFEVGTAVADAARRQLGCFGAAAMGLGIGAHAVQSELGKPKETGSLFLGQDQQVWGRWRLRDSK